VNFDLEELNKAILEIVKNSQIIKRQTERRFIIELYKSPVKDFYFEKITFLFNVDYHISVIFEDFADDFYNRIFHFAYVIYDSYILIAILEEFNTIKEYKIIYPDLKLKKIFGFLCYKILKEYGKF